MISSEELRSLVGCLSTALSELESRVLSLYLDGCSYEQVGERLSCDTKTVDNALQRVKRKVGAHLRLARRRRLNRARAEACGGRHGAPADPAGPGLRHAPGGRGEGAWSSLGGGSGVGSSTHPGGALRGRGPSDSKP